MDRFNSKIRVLHDPRATPEEIKLRVDILQYWQDAMTEAIGRFPDNPCENYLAITVLAAEGGRLIDATTTLEKDIHASYLAFIYKDIYSVPSPVEHDGGKAHCSVIQKGLLDKIERGYPKDIQ